MTIQHIRKSRKDTDRIVFHITSKENPAGEDLTSWADFVMNIDTLQNPADTNTQEEAITGVVIDVTGGRVAFSPTGTIPAGSYFYNAKALNARGKLVTFAEGEYAAPQDI